MTAFRYRLTKYDPKLRDEKGGFQGDDWIMMSQIGKTFSGVVLTLPIYLQVETHHLMVIASFIEESVVTALTAEGVENPTHQFRVEEGQSLAPVEAIEAVRQMLRDEGGCRLTADNFYIHVGWDYYLYLGSDHPCRRSIELAASLGLFIDSDFESPYSQTEE